MKACLMLLPSLCSICGVKLSIICCLQAEKCALKNYVLMCFSYYFWALCLCFLFGLYHIEISLIKKGYVCPSMEASSLRLIPIHFYVTLTSRLMNTQELASLSVLFTNVHNQINRLVNPCIRRDENTHYSIVK